jgi:hypothetical protein
VSIQCGGNSMDTGKKIKIGLFVAFGGLMLAGIIGGKMQTSGSVPQASTSAPADEPCVAASSGCMLISSYALFCTTQSSLEEAMGHGNNKALLTALGCVRSTGGGRMLVVSRDGNELKVFVGGQMLWTVSY